MSASGMTCVPDAELAQMLLCAFRYSLGRQTYITGVCSDWLIKHWALFSAEIQKQIQDDIRKAIRLNEAGHHCDVAYWGQVLELPVKTA